MYNVEIKQPICDDHSIWICFYVHNVLVNINITEKCLWFVTKMITFISNLIFLYQYALERLDVSQFAKLAEISSHHIYHLDPSPDCSIETPCLGIDTWVWKDTSGVITILNLNNYIITIYNFQWLLAITSLIEGSAKSVSLFLLLCLVWHLSRRPTWALYKAMLLSITIP